MSSHTCNEFDVICGRGRSTYLHTGNKHFRVIIDKHMEQYSNAATRLDKSKVVTAICDQVRTRGNFVRQTPDGNWTNVTERMAREKCGQGLRDCLHGRYRSSTQAKQQRRKVDLEEQSAQMAEFIQSNTKIRFVLDELKNELRDGLADDTVQTMFTTANSRILEELKESRIAFPMSEGTIPPASTLYWDASPLPLTRKVTDECDYPQRMSSSSALQILSILA